MERCHNTASTSPTVKTVCLLTSEYKHATAARMGENKIIVQHTDTVTSAHMGSIFISYSRHDKTAVFNLKKEIEAVVGDGVCWIDLTGIESSKMFIDTIIDAIDRADIFLFMYTHASESSEWTRKEIEYASIKSKKIVFVKLEPIPLSKYYQFQFGGHDIIDMADESQKEKLLQNLKTWLPAPQAVATPDVPTSPTVTNTPDSPPTQPPTTKETSTEEPSKNNQFMFYYIDSTGKQQGPVDADTLRTKGITSNTLVWRSGMDEWTRAKDVPELQHIFMTPPPPPHRPTPPQTPSTPTNQQSTGSYNSPSGTSTATANGGDLPPKPDNYLVWSILCTVCCCIPGGIYAIICSNKVDTLYKSGDYEGAKRSAEEAKKWAIISAIVGGIGSFIYGLIVGLGELS